MSGTIIMPQLGETVAEGKILQWFKAVGDDIKPGDRLFEVETDKVTIDVEAVASGKLTQILVRDGETAKAGATVAELGGARAVVKSEPVSKPAAPLSPFEEVRTPLVNFGKARGPDGIRISPLARRLAAEGGIAADLIAAHASKNGLRRICEADVRALLTSAPPAPASHASGRGTESFAGAAGAMPLSAIRQKTAERLTENWRNIPHVFQAVEADFTEIEKVRSLHKASFKTSFGLSLTYLPFIARAVCIALRAFPLVNCRFDGTSLMPSAAVNLGIAVDLDHKGLVVPVLEDAGDLTVSGLAKAMGRMIGKARSGKLSVGDMSGGTYSITNNGAFGTLFTTPIINAPQVAILSVDAIRMRPAIVQTPSGDFIAPRLIGMIGQSFDHRAFDGAYSAAYLARLKAILEERDWNGELAS